MNKFYILFIMFLFPSQIFADHNINTEENFPSLNCQSSEDSSLFDLKRRGYQGCCSHHRGICGCGYGGYLQCCDGTTSPSCRC